MQSLRSQQSVLGSEFAMVLPRAPDPSYLILGPPDLSKHSQEDKYIYGTNEFIQTVNGHFFGWRTTVRAAGLASRQDDSWLWWKDWKYQDGAAALIDSGSSDIVLDSNTYADVTKAVIAAFEEQGKRCTMKGQNDTLVQCFCDKETIAALPVFSISVMSQHMRDFSASTQFTICLGAQEYLSSVGENECRVRFQDSENRLPSIDGGESLLLGLPLFHGYVVGYDIANSKIGFALQKTSSIDVSFKCPSPKGLDFTHTQLALLAFVASVLLYVAGITVWKKSCGKYLLAWREERFAREEERRAIELHALRHDQQEQFLRRFENAGQPLQEIEMVE